MEKKEDSLLFSLRVTCEGYFYKIWMFSLWHSSWGMKKGPIFRAVVLNDLHLSSQIVLSSTHFVLWIFFNKAQTKFYLFFKAKISCKWFNIISSLYSPSTKCKTICSENLLYQVCCFVFLNTKVPLKLLRPAVWCFHKRKLSPQAPFQLSSTWSPFVSFWGRNRAHVLHTGRDLFSFSIMLTILYVRILSLFEPSYPRLLPAYLCT